jgi:hypothetical protein
MHIQNMLPPEPSDRPADINYYVPALGPTTTTNNNNNISGSFLGADGTAVNVKLNSPA